MIRAAAMLVTTAMLMAAIPVAFPQNDEMHWLNPKSSPLSFNTTPKTRIASVENTSRGEITSYQLGCLKMQDERLKVLAKYRTIEGSHLTPDRAGMIPYDTLQKEWQDCNVKQGSLSAIEVWFADGSVWQVPHRAR